MRRLKKSHVQYMAPVKLFLDDVERIYELFGEISDKIEISTDEYALTTPSQLQELHREYLRELRMKSNEPYISLELGPDSIRLYIAEDNSASRGTLEKIKSVLLSRRRRLSRLWPLAYGGAGAAFTLPFIVLGFGIFRSNWPVVIGGVVLLCLSVIGNWRLFVDSFPKYSLVMLKRRMESRSFWQRNSDTIMVAAISATIGALIGSFITLLINALTRAGP